MEEIHDVKIELKGMRDHTHATLSKLTEHLSQLQQEQKRRPESKNSNDRHTLRNHAKCQLRVGT